MAKKEGIWKAIMHHKRLNEQEYSKLINRVMLFVKLGFGAGVCIFLVISLIGGIGKVFQKIISINLLLYAGAIAAVFLGYVLRFVKWNYYLKSIGIKVPLKQNFMVYLSLYSMNITPGKFGRILVAYTLNRLTKIKFANIIPIVAMDIFTDFLGTAIVALIAALYFDKYIIYVAIADIVLMLPFLFVTNDWLFRKFKNIIKKHNRIRMFSIYGDEYFSSQSKLNNRKVYLISLLSTIPAAFLNAMALYLTIIALGIKGKINESVFIFSVSQVAGMVSAVPGNLGVTDGMLMTFLNITYGLTTATSSAVTILTRIATLWFGVILGMVFLFITFKYWKPKTQQKAKKQSGK
ncbi:MAG: lysylphosphatidylglycerol synthase transmembrane domain-containing protein [Candidatus Micrarchaeia archaeon]